MHRVSLLLIPSAMARSRMKNSSCGRSRQVATAAAAYAAAAFGGQESVGGVLARKLTTTASKRTAFIGPAAVCTAGSPYLCQSPSFVAPSSPAIPATSSRSSTRLLSLAVPVHVDAQSSSTTSGASSASNATSIKGRIAARGEVVHFTPGACDAATIGSVAAVRLRDEDVLPTGTTVESMGSKPGVFAAKVADPVIDANEAKPKSSGGTSAARTDASGGQGADFVGRTVIFPSGKTGVVIAERPPIAFVMCDFNTLEDAGDAKADASVSVMGEMTTIAVTEDMRGSVVDYTGRRIAAVADGGNGKDETSVDDNDDNTAAIIANRAIFAPIPKVGHIALINFPMLTGKAMIDALAPLGKGQNTLLLGADREETRALGIDAIATQIKMTSDEKNEEGVNGVQCIYALTSSDPADRADVLKRLNEAGVGDSVVVVASRGDDNTTDEHHVVVRSAAEAVSVAAAACAIGEAHAHSLGRDALVVVDSIDEHKTFWDWTTRVLVDVYGIDAVAKDDRDGGASSEMRGFFSSLVQRAGRFKMNKGGGSITLVMMKSLPGQVGGSAGEDEIVYTPEDFAGASEKVKERIAILTKSSIALTPTNLEKIQIPVPVASETEQKRRLELQHVDDLMSMTDGQIWLDESLASAGQSPSLDPQRSITRIGIGADTMSRADAPALRSLVGGLRFELAQATALEGAGEGSGADRQIRRRDAWMLAMQQNAGERRALSENTVVLLAASIGALDGVVREGGKAGTEEGSSAIRELLDFIKASAAEELNEIDSTLELTDEVKPKLEEAIKAHFDM